MDIKSTKIFIGISGGVDSAVAAGLLKHQGYEVIGVFLKLFRGHSYQAAEKVAKKLNIPFLVMNFQKEFKQQVINYFIKEFSCGRTPNPCVVCNQKIKFGLFLKKAIKMGADFVATGHYIKKSKIKNQKSKFKVQNSKLIYRLYTAKDREKDQSYFLWTLTQKQLSKILFPLGDYTKKEVLQFAEKWNLPYRSKESFDICFLEGADHREFLKKHLKMKSGPIVDIKGKIIGQHQGLPLYTIGQRKNIRIGGIGPFYVIELDFKNNALVVTDNPDDRRLYQKELIAKKVNWISGEVPKLPLRCKARIRYGHKIKPAQIIKDGIRKDVLKVIFDRGQRAITPGQSVVFYRRNQLLGGGIINKI